MLLLGLLLLLLEELREGVHLIVLHELLWVHMRLLLLLMLVLVLLIGVGKLHLMRSLLMVELVHW